MNKQINLGSKMHEYQSKKRLDHVSNRILLPPHCLQPKGWKGKGSEG